MERRITKMTDVIGELSLSFRIRVRELIRICEGEGVTIHPYCSVRTAETQAKLFRQSRTKEEIEQKAQSLRDRGYPHLERILLDVGPQVGTLGKHVTKAGPGESWHQYRLALDCVPLIGGKALWDSKAPEWQLYGEVANYLGLTWAGDWKGFREMPHIQMHQVNNPLTFYKDIERAKKELVE